MSTPKQPTKQERRDAARQARAEAEQAEAASAQRKKRLTVILGAIGAVAVIAIVLIATTGGSDTPGKVDKKTGKLPGSADVAAMLNGVPQSGIHLGNPKAKVTVVEFIDPQCPICKQFANNVFPTLVQDYIRPGKVLYEVRTLSFLGPDSVKGAQFLNAAGLQNKMYNATELLYRNQGQENSGYMTDEFLTSIGKSIPGFDTPKAMAAMKTEAAQNALGEANTMAQKYNVTGTPTLLVGKTGGTLAKIDSNDPTAVDQFKAGIDAALNLNK
jgi:protein-disulfide isomerase